MTKADSTQDEGPFIFEPSKEIQQLSLTTSRLSTFLQTLMTTIFSYLIIILPLLYLWLFVQFSWTRIPLLSYLVFCCIDPAVNNGKGRRCQWVRKLWFWGYINAYFPVRLVLESQLDPTRNYVFGVSPHGILCFSGQVVLGSYRSGVDEALKGVTVHTAILRHALMVPFFRDYALAIGGISASRKSIRKCLAQGPGHSVGIVIGGAKESLHTNRGDRQLILKNRRGFVREAIMAGASLVPMYVFGENDLFEQLQYPWLQKVQGWLQTKMKFALPVFYGKFGFIPKRTPLTAVMGKPIEVEKNPKPSYKEIERMHGRYLEELRRVYEKFKPTYDPEGDDLIIA